MIAGESRVVVCAALVYCGQPFASNYELEATRINARPKRSSLHQGLVCQISPNALPNEERVLFSEG